VRTLGKLPRDISIAHGSTRIFNEMQVGILCAKPSSSCDAETQLRDAHCIEPNCAAFAGKVAGMTIALGLAMRKSTGIECKLDAGVVAPVINRNRCEGKEDCVQVCPYDVFEMRKLSAQDKAAMPLLARLKAFAHGNWQAYAVRANDCHACGLCVSACPEHAIKLERVG